MFDPNRTLSLIRGAIFDAEATWQGYLPEAGDWQKTALLLTGPLIVLSALIAWLIGLAGPDTGFMAQFRPTIGSTLIGMITGAIAAAVVAFVVSALAGLFGGKKSFALGLAATTFAFVPGYLGRAIAPLPWIGGLVAFALFIYSLILLWRVIPVFLEVPQAKRVGHYILSLVSTIVVMILIGMLLRPIIGPDLPEAREFGGAGVSGEAPSGAGGILGGAMRIGELMAAAEEDRYEPPDDGKLEKKQVEEFIRVMRRSRELSAEKQARLEELSERADSDEDISFSDLGEMMAGATEVMGLNTVEIEVVKTAGGNWAEHQWVKETLRTAYIQKDINDTVEHNYALYQRYEDELRPFVAP